MVRSPFTLTGQFRDSDCWRNFEIPFLFPVTILRNNHPFGSYVICEAKAGGKHRCVSLDLEATEESRLPFAGKVILHNNPPKPANERYILEPADTEGVVLRCSSHPRYLFGSRVGGQFVPQAGLRNLQLVKGGKRR